MKKTISIVAAIVVALSIAAPAAAVQPALTDRDRVFVSFLRSEEHGFRNVTAVSLVKLAKKVCHALDDGAYETSVTAYMVDNGFTYNESLAFVGGAIGSYCPRHGGNNIRTK